LGTSQRMFSGQTQFPKPAQRVKPSLVVLAFGAQ
jgi:hypothetical protein